MRHGSEPLAREPSESRITGVRYFTAILAASIATSKQSAGLAAATIGMGDSPFRPNIDCSRSACSVLVGIPVDGPARWMLHTISGNSTDTARPPGSGFRRVAGPAVGGAPREAPH